MPLESLLSSPATRLNVAVEIESVHRVTRVVVTWRYSVLGTDGAPPYLLPLGVLGLGLSEDSLFSGYVTQNLGTIELSDRSHLGAFRPLLDYTFSNQVCRIKIGDASLDYSTYETYRVCRIENEPTLGPGFMSARFLLQSALSRVLNQPLRLNRYVGIPTLLRVLTSSGWFTAPHIAAYDSLTRFVVFLRFSMAAPPSNTYRLFSKFLLFPGNIHWFIALNTSGNVMVTSSSGGVSDINSTFSGNRCDGLIHSIIFARDNDRYAYAAIDNSVLAEYDPSGVVNLSTAALSFGFNTTGQDLSMCDYRILPYFIPPSEAFTIFSVRNDNYTPYAGLWRFDDGSPSTVAKDYSVNGGNDATSSGSLGVDYEWAPSDLGEPEQAGAVIPLVRGVPFNAKADLIDKFRQRYRIADEDVVTGGQTIRFKSRGTLLTSGVDYTDEGLGVYKMATLEDEPITYDIDGTGDEDLGYLTRIIPPLLYNRSDMVTDDIDLLQATALEMLLPWQISLYIDQDKTVGRLLGDLLSPTGLHYYEDPNGDLFMNMLFPPLGLNPHGGPWLDYRGKSGQANRVVFGDILILTTSSSFTLCNVFQVEATDASFITDLVIEPPTGQYFWSKAGSYSLSLALQGSNSGRFVWHNNLAGSLYSIPSLVEAGKKYFLAAAYSAATDLRKIYLGSYETRQIVEIASGPGPGAFGPQPPIPLRFGQSNTGSFFWGAQGMHIAYNNAKTITQLQAIMLDPPDPAAIPADVIFYAPGNEGSGATTIRDLVSGTSGTIHGTLTWTPRLFVNLDETPSVRLSEFHRVSPVWKIVVRYGRNFTPMSDADIDTGVSQSTRISLTREWLEVPWSNETIRDNYPHAREIILDTPLTTQDDAQRLVRYLQRRFNENVISGKVSFPSTDETHQPLTITRRALAMNLEDEVYVAGGKLIGGISLRIVAAYPDLGRQSVEFVVMGELIPGTEGYFEEDFIDTEFI